MSVESDLETTRRLERELALSRAALEPQADIDRIRRCWANFCREADLDHHHEDKCVAVREHAERLQVIQDALVSAGRRRDAISIYRERQRFIIDHDPGLSRVRRWVRKGDYIVTRRGSSVSRLLLIVGALYLVIAPLCYWASDGLVHAGHARDTVNLLDAFSFSLANVAGLSVGDIAADGQGAQLAQAVEGLSAYVFLGFAIWMLTRSYEQG
jgi:hypothetical protein